MLDKYLSDDGSMFKFTGHYMEIYIPMKYYESKLAETQGRIVKTFGILNCTIFDNNMKAISSEIINLPTTIHLHPSEIGEATIHMKNDIDPEPKKYKVCKFYKGNVVMPSSVQQDSSNAEMFIDIIFGNKLESNVPYNKLLDIWEKNLQLNNVKMSVSASILEMIISEIYRNRKNPNERFAKVIGSDPKTSPYEYRAASIREICSRNSTFAALTFEDMDAMITTSLNINKYNKKQTQSPIEKIIKM